MRSETRRPFFADLTQALTDAIRHGVRYNTTDENGETRAERNARFGMAHKTPDEPEIPKAGEHVWEWFWRLSTQRRSGMAGAEAFGWEAIHAWARLTGTIVRPEEVEMLVMMDLAYRNEVGSEQRAKQAAESP